MESKARAERRSSPLVLCSILVLVGCERNDIGTSEPDRTLIEWSVGSLPIPDALLPTEEHDSKINTQIIKDGKARIGPWKIDEANRTFGCLVKGFRIECSSMPPIGNIMANAAKTVTGPTTNVDRLKGFDYSSSAIRPYASSKIAARAAAISLWDETARELVRQTKEARFHIELDHSMEIGQKYKARLYVEAPKPSSTPVAVPSLTLNAVMGATPQPTVIVPDNRIQITPIVGAKVTGDKLDPSPKTIEWKHVTQANIASWEWDVDPSAEGQGVITFYLMNKLNINGKSYDVDVGQFPQSISVTIGWAAYVRNQASEWAAPVKSFVESIGAIWGLIGAGALALFAWLMQRLRRRGAPTLRAQKKEPVQAKSTSSESGSAPAVTKPRPSARRRGSKPADPRKNKQTG